MAFRVSELDGCTTHNQSLCFIWTQFTESHPVHCPTPTLVSNTSCLTSVVRGEEEIRRTGLIRILIASQPNSLDDPSQWLKVDVKDIGDKMESLGTPCHEAEEYCPIAIPRNFTYEWNPVQKDTMLDGINSC